MYSRKFGQGKAEVWDRIMTQRARKKPGKKVGINKEFRRVAESFLR